MSEFLADFDTMSGFGATANGGVERQAGSEADGLTRDWFRMWLTKNGFRCRVDAVGNLFGSLEWIEGAPHVLVGSHLDSQPKAGRFDGAYGVLAGAHAATTVAERVAAGKIRPAFNLTVVDWFNEEGCRFSPSLMGSGVFTGKFTAEKILDVVDADGCTVRTALRNIGYLGADEPPMCKAYVEIHIEQGRVLEDEEISIGVVTANWAVRKYRVRIRGEQAHTGATLIEDRRDALLGAAQMIVATREVASAFPPGVVLTSISKLTVEPNSPVVVASDVVMAVDIRSSDETTLAKAHELFLQARTDIEARGEVSVDVESGSLRPSTPYHRAGIELSESIADGLGLSARRMLTRAGHDSINLKDLMPTVMLFVPSVGGVSHSEIEYTEPEDLLAGLNVLTGVLERLVVEGLSSEQEQS
ncbi:M20 family metallo-hydrolase [Rhodococcus erythropolis]|uniref:M20 family metallo-hydrolase n=1 Tax=Rhodococcus TaxID=1827 RepID=UPI0003F85A17|nr:MULTISPECIES: M20 family metallo-hydrolase [Rhodococcus]MBF7732689.1 M20 family metallo-hydrolase [Rhodococcus erythropolis]MBO8149433.1 M20 family metallo-hydrolase [Rhodococcus erythropolis]MBT1258568.1 M20 family metallo-hydrolase [Rhodococcus erythropolis]MCJ0900843.1 M20 family metallo-hydrolase [Rhodococcus sp. ARC_M13]MCZ4641346.1 M20 family metallo-hydrolase [Rhodococcus erythropolis]